MTRVINHHCTCTSRIDNFYVQYKYRKQTNGVNVHLFPGPALWTSLDFDCRFDHFHDKIFGRPQYRAHDQYL